MAPAEEADRNNQDEAAFNKELAAVEPVDRDAFQAWSGKEAVKEKSHRGEIDAEVK